MAHPYRGQSDSTGKSKMHALAGSGAKGGWQNGNTAGEKYGLKRAEGGSVGRGMGERGEDGTKDPSIPDIFPPESKKRAYGVRLDRHARGGKAKSKKSPKINIKIVSNKGEPASPLPPAPLGPAGLSGLVPPAPPPGLPMPPPGMMGMRKRGGKSYADGGKVTGSSYPKSIKPHVTTPTTGGVLDTEAQMKFLKRERGGAAMKKYPITGGAEGGLGRLQLSRAQKKDRLARGG